MNRKVRLTSSASWMGFWVLLLCSVDVLAAPGRPNILMLVAEDLSPRVGAYGDSVANTPNIDQLAAEGVLFSNVFATASVCAPSRAAVITGLQQISFAALHHRTQSSPVGEYYAVPPDGVQAFPELLRKAGYYTFTDAKLDYQFSGLKAGSGPFTIWDDQGSEAHWSKREKGQPFFGLLNLMETHESGVMEPLGFPHSWVHARTMVLRHWRGLVSEEVTNPNDVEVPPYLPDVPEIRADIARHYDNIHALDEHIGRILSQLRKDGLLENTIIIWTSDHGDGLPRSKRDLYDTGLRVPLVVRFPDTQRAGQVDSRLVSLVDLAPTVLMLAGVEPQRYHHGLDFLNRQRQYVFSAKDRIDWRLDRQRSIGDGRYKYIRSWYPNQPEGLKFAYRDNLRSARVLRRLFGQGELSGVQAKWFGGPGEERLFDTLNDKFELKNLIDEPSVAAVQARLVVELDAWLERTGDQGDIDEAELRESLLVESEIPGTPIPKYGSDQGLVWLNSEVTESLGYRIDGGQWRLYRGPFKLEPGQICEAKAIRYGWRESGIVRIDYASLKAPP